MFALVDCNNFYASCECVFDPKLIGKPVVVLSNNDGCIIARSQEARALGIKIGTPVHEIKDKLKKHHIAIFSSNYALYGDMSARVIEVLYSFVEHIEVYSIDESFLDLSGYGHMYSSLEMLAGEIKARVFQWTGIPVSIGIAPTKTLAKTANKIAKKGSGVHILETEAQMREALISTDIADVWGIGRRYAAKLKNQGIDNAYQFAQAKENWVLQQMSVVGQRLYLELNAQPCLRLEMVKNKKCIGSSRSFLKPISSLDILKEAVATYVSRCAEKLRKQQSCANLLVVFIRTNRFKKDEAQYNRSQSIALPVPTDNTLELIRYALKGVEYIYCQGYNYKKAGVMLTGIVPAAQRQMGIHEQSHRKKQPQTYPDPLMQVMDKINQKMGRFTLRSAAMGNGSSGFTVQKKLSANYTTRWEDIITVKAET